MSISYTAWLLIMVELILQQNPEMTVSDISLNHEDCMEYYKRELSPKKVYFGEWNMDAGHYYKIPF